MAVLLLVVADVETLVDDDGLRTLQNRHHEMAGRNWRANGSICSKCGCIRSLHLPWSMSYMGVDYCTWFATSCTGYRQYDTSFFRPLCRAVVQKSMTVLSMTAYEVWSAATEGPCDRTQRHKWSIGASSPFYDYGRAESKNSDLHIFCRIACRHTCGS